MSFTAWISRFPGAPAGCILVSAADSSQSVKQFHLCGIDKLRPVWLLGTALQRLSYFGGAASSDNSEVLWWMSYISTIGWRIYNVPDIPMISNKLPWLEFCSLATAKSETLLIHLLFLFQELIDKPQKNCFYIELLQIIEICNSRIYSFNSCCKTQIDWNLQKK